MKRDEVVRILHEQQKELVERYHIASLSLFGSVARDEARVDSDIDIMVKFARPTGLFQFIDLKKRLEALFGCKVDIGKQRSLKPHLRARVLQEAIRVF
jgi:predicted nucleotidyltransferase